MSGAIGWVNMIVRGGETTYEALYQPSYRHSARRVPSSEPLNTWKTEQQAVEALKRVAASDGSEIIIRAGKYHYNTRKHGEVIS